MRNIAINIQQRVSSDNAYNFSPTPSSTYNSNSPYEFLGMILNYSIVDSNVISTLELSLNQPVDPSNVLRSGQPIQIYDNGNIIFEGVLLACKYEVSPIEQNGQGNNLLIATLAPSIYQLTLIPMIFNNVQAQQIANLLNINTNALLIGGIAQDTATNALLNYMISNTDYSLIFNKSISFTDLGDQLFVMAQTNQSRDSVLRQSINFYNCVLFQDETGQININQLSASNSVDFTLDLQNNANADPNLQTLQPIIPMLSYEYNDNAYSTPAMVSNYAILNSNLSIAANVNELLVSYGPNPDFYPRLKQLQQTGWFTGIIGNTQINQNIVNDPTAAKALNQYAQNPDQYMISLINNTAKNPTIGAYQALLTGKQLANALTGYSSLTGTISLDDPALANIAPTIVGKVVQINNCDMQSGIIATCSRIYSGNGSYLNFNIAPLGSITGYWKN